jgi:hypothetical protein
LVCFWFGLTLLGAGCWFLVVGGDVLFVIVGEPEASLSISQAQASNTQQHPKNKLTTTPPNNNHNNNHNNQP